MTFTEPTPPRHQITGIEQKRVIRAALDQLNPVIHEIRPHPEDSLTLAQHIEMALMDSLTDAYAFDAIPRLFRSMSEAAVAEMLQITSERNRPVG